MHATSVPRRGSRPRPASRLRVVPPVRRRPPRVPFVLLVAGILATGLVGMLLLNTALAQDSFVLHDLRKESAALTDREQTLEQEVGVLSSPQNLAERAERLGMVPGGNPAFVDRRDGSVLGVPEPGKPPAPRPSTGQTAPSGESEAGGGGEARDTGRESTGRTSP